MRGVSGDGMIGPGPIMQAARAADLTFFLDRAARITSIREAARHGVAATLFINFTPTSIYDPAFCLRTTIVAIEEAGFAPRPAFRTVDVGSPAESGHSTKEMIAAMPVSPGTSNLIVRYPLDGRNRWQ